MERTMKVASDGFLSLDFEVCWSGGPDALSSGFIDGYCVLNVGQIYQVLICWLDVK